MTEKCDISSVDEQTAIRIASLFESLSDPSRVRIISALVMGEVNVGDLVQIMGLSKSAISHQLRGLRDKRVIRARNKAGRYLSPWMMNISANCSNAGSTMFAMNKLHLYFRFPVDFVTGQSGLPGEWPGLFSDVMNGPIFPGLNPLMFLAEFLVRTESLFFQFHRTNRITALCPPPTGLYKSKKV